MFKKVGKHIPGVFLFLLAFISATVFTGFGNDAEFKSAVWLQANARDRGRMADDLVVRGSLIGKSIDDVRETLGMSDKDWGRVHQYQIDLDWPMKDPKTYGLQVHFDADRNVSLVKIVD